MLSLLHPIQCLKNPMLVRSFTRFVKKDDCRILKDEVYNQTKTGIKYLDMVVGEGAEIQKGDIVHMHHKGRFLRTGKPMSFSSYDIGAPLSFKVGEGWVIPAWDETVLGMKTGGKRKVIATPDVAYGEKGANDIPPNSTIVYELEVVGTGMDGMKGSNF
ncbi:hypothetical protein WA158_000175 [Blastocystis sp. Blastoise]